MEESFIRVTQRRDDMWTVLSGTHSIALIAFKLKSHAVSYARAISFSRKLALFVDDKNGTAIRQICSSLTYPVWLD